MEAKQSEKEEASSMQCRLRKELSLSALDGSGPPNLPVPGSVPSCSLLAALARGCALLLPACLPLF